MQTESRSDGDKTVTHSNYWNF